MTQDTIVIKTPAGTKARWVRQSQAESMKLTDWITKRVDSHEPRAIQKPHWVHISQYEGVKVRDWMVTHVAMTQDQFTALTKITGLRSHQTKEALRLILIDGLPVGEAARSAGISQSSASHALARARKMLDLARQATKQ